MNKKVLANLEKCYSIAPLHYKNADHILVAAEKTDRCICCCHQILWRHASRNRRSCKSVYVGGGRGACSYGYYNQDTWV